EAGKQGQGLFSLQKLQSFSIAGLFQDAVQKPIEVVDRLCRVRRRSEEMRELLDQRRRQPQLLLLGRIHDLAPMPAAYVKTVEQPAHAVEFVHKQALLIGGKRHSRQGADLEDVHDFLSGETGVAPRPVAWDRATQ